MYNIGRVMVGLSLFLRVLLLKFLIKNIYFFVFSVKGNLNHIFYKINIYL